MGIIAERLQEEPAFKVTPELAGNLAARLPHIMYVIVEGLRQGGELSGEIWEGLATATGELMALSPTAGQTDTEAV